MQSIAWKCCTFFLTYVIVPLLSVITTVDPNIIKMISSVNQLARGYATTCIKMLRLLHWNSSIDLILPLVQGCTGQDNIVVIGIDAVVM